MPKRQSAESFARQYANPTRPRWRKARVRASALSAFFSDEDERELFDRFVFGIDRSPSCVDSFFTHHFGTDVPNLTHVMVLSDNDARPSLPKSIFMMIALREVAHA